MGGNQRCRSGLKVISTISSSARVPPAASSPTGCRPIPKNRVLILEAGGNDNWIWFHIPVGYLFAIGNPRSDWMFRTEPEPGLNGRSLAYPRGKVIGGSSAINAMISMRGQAADYDHWRQLGLTGWGYDDVLPRVPAAGGSFPRRERASRHRRRLADRGAAAVLGHSRRGRRRRGGNGHPNALPDFNTGDNEGIGYFHVNQKRGRRWSSARGFLKPVLNRPNLRLEKNVLVDRLIVESGRAVGVRFMQGGEVVEARTKGEVILCAGSIGSTQVLHRSGIGPADWLSPLGIDIVLDRPGVGRNLQDHLQQRAIYKVEGVRTLNETYYSLFRRGLMGLDYAFRRRGPLTMAPSQLGIFTRSDPHRERANIQFHVQPLSLDKFGDPLHRFPAITVSACNLQPTSRGTVRIRSAKPDEAPVDRAELSVDRRRPPGRRRRHPHHAAADEAEARSRNIIRRNICPAHRSATTMPRWRKPPAISAPRSSIPSAPRRWARRAIRWPWSTNGCASTASPDFASSMPR